MNARTVTIPRAPEAAAGAVPALAAVPETLFEMPDVYRRPARRDLAVCMAHFNFAGFRRPVLNLRTVWELLRRSGIPVFLIQLRREGDPLPPPLADVWADDCGVFTVTCKTPTFAKERLLNLLEARVPAHYRKLLFLDHDVIFRDRAFVDTISRALDAADVVQPYSRAMCLDPTWSKPVKPCAPGHWLHSVGAYLHRPASAPPIPAKDLQMGLVWAMRRDAFHRLGGLFDKAILGSGDRFIARTAFPHATLFNWEALRSIARCEIDGYLRRVDALELRGAVLQGDVFHLWHGHTDDRRYGDRHALLVPDPARSDHLTINADGVYELVDPATAAAVLRYFQSREEDNEARSGDA